MSVSTCIDRPMPRPSTSRYALERTADVVSVIRESRSRPMPMMIDPATGNTL
jgi:hypothetical protein